MSESPTITPEDLAEIWCDGDPEPGTTAGPWTCLGAQHRRTARWLEHHWLVLRHDPTGEVWGIGYAIGRSELQDWEVPWDKATAPIRMDTRLYPHEITRTEYRTTPQEAQQ